MITKIIFIFAVIMKYTNYLINGDVVNMESIQTNNRYFKLPMELISIPVAFIGVIIISGMIPMAFMLDGVRNIKAELIHFKRKKYKIVTILYFFRIIKETLRKIDHGNRTLGNISTCFKQ